MLTLRAAAALLAGVDSITSLARIAAVAGCDAAPAPLDQPALHAIGLDRHVPAAYIASGPGALRALLLEIDDGAPLCDHLTRAASRLASRAPHALWLLLAVQPATATIAVAAWHGAHRPPRVAALIVQRQHVVMSDAEAVVALASTPAAHAGADVLAHARWVEVLGREALTRRFYRTLEQRVAALAGSARVSHDEDRAEIALLYTSRLLFLAFLEAKGWLDGRRDFLSAGFDECMRQGGAYHRRVLLPLFFGTLNTRVSARAPAARALGRIPFLNGGLFSRTLAERRAGSLRFSDEALGALYAELFARYRFTAREESATWSEVAVDPEMLGKAFESLMATSTRKASGTFYTPHALVDRVMSAGLTRSVGNATIGHSDAVALRERIGKLTVLDPACGSGAFLVHTLERLADLLRLHGDMRPLAVIRRQVLTRSIFGVDRSATAVWLCELRLWLSVVIESDVADPREVPALPNLDRNVRVGDSLAGRGFEQPTVTVRDGAPARSIGRLRESYSRATGARKESLARQLDREERRLALQRLDAEAASVIARRHELLLSLRGRDLFGERRRATRDERSDMLDLRERAAALRAERRRLASGGALPFSFAVHFADVAMRGGFDLVLGNPPWVRLKHIPAAERETLRCEYRVFRHAGWQGGAERAHAGRGFAAQIDLAALFVERSLRLLKPGAVLSLLLPVKLWRSLAGGGLRRLLAEVSRIVALEDYSEAPSGFDAAVYPSLLVAERCDGAHEDATPAEIAAVAHRGASGPLCWRVPNRTLGLDGTTDSPWLVVPNEVRAAFDRLRDAGVPLADSALGRPHLGVKCGFNLAFVVRCIHVSGDGVAEIESATGRRGAVEAELLRPLVRGEGLRPWVTPATGEHIIWTHSANGAALRALSPLAARWLSRWQRELAARSDARGRPWWSLFRIDAARCDRPRVLWADLGRTPRATMVPAGNALVPLNSCYVAICRDEVDALALTTLLNSPLVISWLSAIAEPARGSYHRFLGWTMSLLPIPRDWERAREILAFPGGSVLAEAARPSSMELLARSLEAYGLRHTDVAPLLAWFTK